MTPTPGAPAQTGTAAPAQEGPQAGRRAEERDEARQPEHWVALSRLIGRPIVDLSDGKRVGEVEDVLLSGDRRSLEAYVTRGRFLHRAEVFPARGATIGDDAITLPAGALAGFDAHHTEGLPLGRSLAGMRLLTDTGRVVGTLHEIRVDPRTAAVLGYEVQPTDPNLLQRLRHDQGFLPVDAVEQYGADALIVREEHARRHLGDFL